MEGTRIALALPAPPIINRKSAKAAVGSRQQTQIAADSFSQRHKGACSATLGPVLSPRSGGVGTRRCYAARSLPPRGWNSSRSVWRQAGYGGQRRDAFLRSAFTLRTTIATSTFIGVQRSSLAPGMTLGILLARGRAQVSVAASRGDWPKRTQDQAYSDQNHTSAA
eukprot:COSAG06_NODE_6543_length_2887_cov_16.353659_3_plen_166_part_00